MRDAAAAADAAAATAAATVAGAVAAAAHAQRPAAVHLWREARGGARGSRQDDGPGGRRGQVGWPRGGAQEQW